MDDLLHQKMHTNPYDVCIGDRIYYLKKDGQKDLYFSGCAYITDIILTNSDVILTLEGSAPVARVRAIMVGVYDEEEKDTYKLILNKGEFTYSYTGFLNAVFGVKTKGGSEYD